MFEDASGMFNGMFGKLGPGCCRITMNGNIAVKAGGGYKTYNVSKGTLTNVSSFCFDVGEEFFFVIPTNKVAVGDIILVDKKPKCVIELNGKKSIKVIDYESSEIREIVPERHVFMGSAYFYGKIVSMFGNGNALKNGKGMNKIMQMMMMKEMFKGEGSGSSGFGGIGQLMMMNAFMGGNGMDKAFSNMFDFSFDSVEDDEENDDDESSVKDSTEE